MHTIKHPLARYFVTSLVALAALAASGHARAQGLDDIRAGSLIIQGPGGPAAAIALDTKVRMVIRGPVARVAVTQRFTNPSADWVEGVYAFPLPDQAAVDRLQLKIGERVIEGEIREKHDARRVFQRARESGQRAVLVEQHRPNLFTTQVTNIAPGQTIEVILAYVQPVTWQDGRFSLRFPMRYTPRYRPGTMQDLTPPHGAPAVELDIWLQAGMALESLTSPYHEIVVREQDGWRHIRLAQDTAAARDFVLSWKPEPAREPRVISLAERVGGETYALAMIMPPALLHAQSLPREIIFIVDTSGSMHGESMQQAKRAVTAALSLLEPGDRFNVIRFDSEAEALFPHPVAADGLNTGGAADWVRTFQAEGGTNMAPALKIALDGAPPRGYLRQVVFLTDGAVGNTRELLKLIHAKLGEARLFTVGIGAAPNTWFMREVAEFGHGTYTYIAKPEEVQTRMDALFTRLSHPVMKDVCINWQVRAQSYPDPVPDLYAGEPIVVFAKLSTLDGKLQACGQRAGLNWQTSAKVANSRRHAGIAKLWARRRIESLMESKITGADPAQVRAAVVATALKHHLASPYTSLVAVDKTPARTRAALHRRAIAGAAPTAWAQAAALPQTATAAPLHALLGLAGLLCAALAWRLGRGREVVS